MSTTVVQFLKSANAANSFYTAGDVAGFSSSLAATLVSNGVCVEFNAGSGAGVVVPAGSEAQEAWETTAAFTARNPDGTPNPSAAIHGYEGETTIVRGRAVPNSEPWA